VFSVSSVLKLFHRDLGGAGQPPLVILHGMLGSSRNWSTAGAGLAEHFHVFALDLRNHGRSPHADEMGYAALVGDVLGWLDAQGLAQVTLLGHSLGGKVAMWLACRVPARVARLVVVDIAPRDYPEKLERAEFAAMKALDLAAVRTRADAERAMEPVVPGWAMRKFLATNLEQDATGAWRWVINLPALNAAVPELIRTPLAPDDRFAGPARFIIGAKSDFVRAEDTAVIRQHFPAAEIVTLDTGHNPHMEAREALVRAVVKESARDET
jgi:pimeloyl-ACP methyl ester carboxylesterase